MKSAPVPGRHVGLRLFIMMALQFSIWGAWLPLVWTYMGELGFSPGQIALVGSTFAIAAIAGIFFGNQFVDRTFAAERFMAGSHLVGGLAMLGLYFTTSFPLFFALMLIHSIAYVPTISVANSLAFAHLKNAQREFGLVRMGGTIGWILVSWPLYFMLRDVTAGSVREAYGNIFLVAACASLLLSAFALVLPHTPPATGMAAEKPAWREAWRFLCSSRFLLVLFIVTLLDATIHNGYFLLTGGFFSHIGVASELIMPAMSIGQVAEILTMAVLGYFLQRLGWKWTMIAGIAGHAARFLVFALLPESMGAVIAVQVLHGVCYAFFFAALYIFIDAAFPHEVRTSAQGLFNLLILGIGDLAAKWLFLPLQSRLTVDGVTDYRTLFLIPAGMAAVAVVLLLVGFHPPRALRGSGGPGATDAAKAEAAPASA